MDFYFLKNNFFFSKQIMMKNINPRSEIRKTKKIRSEKRKKETIDTTLRHKKHFFNRKK